ncbi:MULTISPECIES: amino acid ABC transporter ATP-binding protein [Rickettsieae]|uniref:amino acid ABC transporter ATP-binding protein n=1 Tax=Rickettsieae TaxID=33988 RepID=UPI001E6F905E|nr:amino acid ABC transporter ATP-binding protein [Rickettsia endosymbiont of Oedothorax gibbosus]UCM85553.1 MAG: amino acid ABC transporter ATP-binding protein [Rickettsia endosymbiont of Culicoides impunctatus]
MIVVDKVSKKYSKIYAVKDVSLEFKKKETIAIIGSSGSGKSTLLRIINALEIPTTGQVFVDNKKLTQKNKRKLCLKIGMVFQSFNLFPHLNVQDNLIYAPVNILKMQQMTAISKAKKLLEQFGLKQKVTAFPINLSGGQKQRVAICRALMMDPEVMLFDEPTSALDPENIKDIIEIISSLKSQMTMIVVTHHIKFAKAIADRIIFMNHGQVLADQPAAEFFEKPKSHRARLFLENIGDLM